MLTLEAEFMALLDHPERTFKDGKREAYSQVQLLTEELLQDGQLKHGMQTISMDPEDAAPFREFRRGQLIRVPVRAYVRGGSVAYALPPSPTPEKVSKAPPGASAAA